MPRENIIQQHSSEDLMISKQCLGTFKQVDAQMLFKLKYLTLALVSSTLLLPSTTFSPCHSKRGYRICTAMCLL
jgi:hypothetical protein